MISARRIILKALYEEYEVLEVRASNLEKFMQCPFRYQTEEGSKSTEDYFVYGHIMHTMCQEFCRNSAIHKNYEDALNASFSLLNLYPQYSHIIEPYFQELHKLGLKAIASNVQVFCEVELGKYLLVITGGFDMITQDGRMIDFKFPKGERKQEKVDTLRQRRIYPFLYGGESGYDKVKTFDYIVMTKHQKGGVPRPRVQIFKNTINQDFVEKKVLTAIKAFVIANYLNEFKAERGDHCFTCKNKAQGKCNLRW